MDPIKEFEEEVLEEEGLRLAASCSHQQYPPGYIKEGHEGISPPMFPPSLLHTSDAVEDIVFLGDGKLERLFAEQQRTLIKEFLAQSSRLMAEQESRIVEAVTQALRSQRENKDMTSTSLMSREEPNSKDEEGVKTNGNASEPLRAVEKVKSVKKIGKNSPMKSSPSMLRAVELHKKATCDDKVMKSEGLSAMERIKSAFTKKLEPLNNQFSRQFSNSNSDEGGGSRSTSLAQRSIEALERDPKRQVIYRLVHSSMFDAVVVSCILLNAVLVGVESDWRMQSSPGESKPGYFDVFDAIFCVVFTTELVMRIWVERGIFFTGKHWRWNMLDVIVVVSAIAEEVMTDTVVSMTVMRLLRILRLARVIRGIRVLKYFRDLRLMVDGIISCFKSLLWCIVLLLFVMFVVSVTLLDLLHGNLESERCLSDVECSDLFSHFGSLWLSIYSLFKSITGGNDWGAFSDAMGVVHPAIPVVFSAYIAFTVFTILNIVTGVFVENASAFAQNDHENCVMEDLDKRKELMQNMRKTFLDADVDGNGQLDWREFQRHFENPQVQALMRNLEISVECGGAKGLFDMLDFEGEGAVDIDAFVIGMTHIRGPARALDVAKLRHDMSKINSKLKDLCEVLGEAFGVEIFDGSSSEGLRGTFFHPSLMSNPGDKDSNTSRGTVTSRRTKCTLNEVPEEHQIEDVDWET